MKRRSTREILAASFRQLAEKKNVDKITIREITDNCGYSTVTFYRQFLDKYDMISWAYSEDIKSIMKDHDSSISELAMYVAQYYHDNRIYLRNLLKHTSGYDSFVRNMTELNYSFFSEFLLKASPKIEMDEQTISSVRVYVLGTVHFTCELLLSEQEIDEKRLSDVFLHTMPLQFREIVKI